MIHKEFKPNKTPKQVFQEGAFGGTYFRPIYSSITKSKPDAVKGSFIKKVSIASTMGFGLEINSSFLR